MSYTRVKEALGATPVNTPGFTLMSQGQCYNATLRQTGDAQTHCAGDLAKMKSTTTSKPGFFENLWSGIKTTAQARAGSQQQLVVGGGTPGWVMPVAIGGIGLVAVLLLTKKRGGGEK